jgi:hypothetical protein
MTGISRRSAGLGMAAIAISSLYDGARAQVESITLPFGNGAYRLSPAMNSCATCRLKAMLWERCLVMAFIL